LAIDLNPGVDRPDSRRLTWDGRGNDGEFLNRLVIALEGALGGIERVARLRQRRRVCAVSRDDALALALAEAVSTSDLSEWHSAKTSEDDRCIASGSLRGVHPSSIARENSAT
jgi:hypothetical protein